MAKLCTWAEGVTLTWTEQVIAADVAPDVDTALTIGPHVHHIYCEWTTVGADTGAPNFTFNIITSFDGTTFTTGYYATLVSAAAKDVIGSCMLTPPNGATALKARLTVAGANLAAGEFVILKLRPVME